MKRRTCLAVILTVMLFCVVGCQNETGSTSKPGTDDANRNADGQTKAGEVTNEVTVTVASWEEVQQMVAGHAGKVVVIDLWSTWCVPCVRRVPQSGEIAGQIPR